MRMQQTGVRHSIPELQKYLANQHRPSVILVLIAYGKLIDSQKRQKQLEEVKS